MRTVQYTTVAERRELSADANKIGESVIHNTHLELDKQGNVILGELVLDVKPEPSPSTDALLYKELTQKLATGNLTLAETNDALRLLLGVIKK